VPEPDASPAAEAGIAVPRMAFGRWVGEADDHDLATVTRQSLEHLREPTAGRWRPAGYRAARRSQPWNEAWSPASHASRRPGLARSQSGRLAAVAARRSRHRSSVDGRPQNQ
jgi:hypothetical protein